MSKNNEKNILFIIPEFFYIDKYQEGLYYNDFPIGTLTISSYLRKYGNIKTDIIDLRVESDKYPDLALRIPDEARIKPALMKVLENNNIQEFQNVGISCYTSFQYSYADFIANILREEFPNINIIVGGYHPTAVPEDFTYKDSPYDYIIRCEAESMLLQLFKSNILTKPIMNKGPIIKTSSDLINLNTVPFPDYELYLRKYPYKNRFNFEMYISRGCPYQCSFCAKNWKFREYTFKNFIPQFKKVMNLVDDYDPEISKISFADQSFNRVNINNKILDFILTNNLHEQYSFACQSRVETMGNDLKKINKVRKARLVVGYGFESANPRLLREMHKTENPDNHLELMRKIVEKYITTEGTYCRLNILCGFPGEDKKSFNDSVDFLKNFESLENIQISPTLFSNYANIYVYQNIDYFEKKYGSVFIREWWKLPENPLKTCIVQRPSRDYSLKELLKSYIDNYLPFLQQFKKHNFKALIFWKQFYSKWYNEL